MNVWRHIVVVGKNVVCCLGAHKFISIDFGVKALRGFRRNAGVIFIVVVVIPLKETVSSSNRVTGWKVVLFYNKHRRTVRTTWRRTELLGGTTHIRSMSSSTATDTFCRLCGTTITVARTYVYLLFARLVVYRRPEAIEKLAVSYSSGSSLYLGIFIVRRRSEVIGAASNHQTRRRVRRPTKCTNFRSSVLCSKNALRTTEKLLYFSIYLFSSSLSFFDDADARHG